jgi:alkylation response protein AidB-like acyl-CoA dehydrogenase
MDFAFTPEQEALRDLARTICQDHATQERLKAVERDPDWFDRELWAALAKANLLGVAVPEDVGGGGLGLEELCLLLEQVGAAVAPVPAWATLVLGALPVAEFGSAAQRERWLRPVTAGKGILTAALVELPAEEPAAPQTTAVRDGGGWRLDGVKDCVPAAHLAGGIVVPASTGDGRVGMFLIEPSAPGVTLERLVATNKEPQARLTLAGARVAADGVLGDPVRGRAMVDWLLDRALLGLCALELGVAERALRITAQYTAERRQFDRPIASFQAVQQRAADAWIDVEAIRLTTWQAAWRLDRGLPAREEVMVAKFWAAEAGHRIVYAAQHLHGGIGVDVDYPIHRYYLWSKALELTLGSGARQLARLGEALAAER